MKEREAKLAAPAGFDLPELGGPDDGFLAEPQAPRRLQTTYYDTPDLRLARWGASLRYRPGEGWTVKLPEGEHGVLLVRAEHVFGGDGRPPGGGPLPRAGGRAGRGGRRRPAPGGAGPAAGRRRPGGRADPQVPARP